MISASAKGTVFKRRGRRVHSLFGTVLYALPDWDGVHETFNDYDDGMYTDGGDLGQGVGWGGDPILATTEGLFAVARDYVEAAGGYTASATIAGVNGGSGFAGAWEVD